MHSGILQQALASGNVRGGDALAAQRKVNGIATLRDATRSLLPRRGTLKASPRIAMGILLARASLREHLGVSTPLDGTSLSQCEKGRRAKDKSGNRRRSLRDAQGTQARYRCAMR